MDQWWKWRLISHLKQEWYSMWGYNLLVGIITTKQTELSLRGKMHRTPGTLLSPFKRDYHHSNVVFVDAKEGEPISPHPLSSPPLSLLSSPSPFSGIIPCRRQGPLPWTGVKPWVLYVNRTPELRCITDRTRAIWYRPASCHCLTCWLTWGDYA